MDNRWVCKVSDYGLNYVKQCSGLTRSSDGGSLLWMSPELLRGVVATPTIYKRSDVYSYGIICQEIVHQNAPYCHNFPELDASEIVANVKLPLNPPYRPQIPKGKILNLCF